MATCGVLAVVCVAVTTVHNARRLDAQTSPAMIHTIAGRIGFGDGGPVLEATAPDSRRGGGRRSGPRPDRHRVRPQRAARRDRQHHHRDRRSRLGFRRCSSVDPPPTFPQIRALGGMSDGTVLIAISRAFTHLATDGSLSDLANTVLTSTSPCRGALTQGVLRISSSIR